MKTRYTFTVRCARSLVKEASQMVISPDCVPLLNKGKGPGAGTGSSDGSGAGFGGTGGSGRVTMTTRSPYGDYTNPRVFGSGGGKSNAGSGGGVLSLEISEALVVEGKFQEE